LWAKKQWQEPLLLKKIEQLGCGVRPAGVTGFLLTENHQEGGRTRSCFLRRGENTNLWVLPFEGCRGRGQVGLIKELVTKTVGGVNVHRPLREN